MLVEDRVAGEVPIHTPQHFDRKYLRRLKKRWTNMHRPKATSRQRLRPSQCEPPNVAADSRTANSARVVLLPSGSWPSRASRKMETAALSAQIPQARASGSQKMRPARRCNARSSTRERKDPCSARFVLRARRRVPRHPPIAVHNSHKNFHCASSFCSTSNQTSFLIPRSLTDFHPLFLLSRLYCLSCAADKLLPVYRAHGTAALSRCSR